MTTETPISRIPVTILTGFLGAGKTTLLNHLLQADHGLRIAVLVNDFGAINIDSHLVVGIEGETISLSNGCICCTIRDDLQQAVLQLAERPDPPETILIETSGVSDPHAVINTFISRRMRQQFQLDSVVTVIDAEQVHAQPTFADLIGRQIAAADIVLLNKCDLVSAARLAEVREWVQSVVPRTRVLETVQAQAPLALLTGIDRDHREQQHLPEPHPYAPAQDHTHDLDQHLHDHTDHGTVFQTWSYESELLLARHQVWDALTLLPPGVFRAKGILALAESPRRQVIMHLVGRRLTLTPGEPWGDTVPRNQIVLIGLPGSLDQAAIAPYFDACVAQHPLHETLSIIAELTRRAWRGLIRHG